MKWDRDWLETMYNNRVRVANAEEYISKWTAASIDAQETLKEHAFLDVAYGQRDSQRLDIFMPTKQHDNTQPPVLIFIHGGYWHALDKKHFSFVATPFTQAGACVVVVNYTLCPSINVACIVDEITQAFIWIKRNIAQYGGDPNRITVSGHSAGGHLTAMMFTQDWKRLLPELNQDSPFLNGLSLSGLYDLAPLQHTPFLSVLALDDNDLNHANPIKLPLMAKQSELYSLVGANESEEFLRQNTLLKQHWGEKQTSYCKNITSLDHFSIVQAFCQPEHEVFQLALRLLGLESEDS